jgi:hypothetical protein
MRLEVAGSVNCLPEFVGKGDSSTCTVVPDEGYRVKDWTDDCEGVGTNTQCYLGKITKDQTSKVIFEMIPFSGTDNNGDGVVNGNDDCKEPPSGVIVDQNGCSIEQLFGCDQFRNHGQ